MAEAPVNQSFSEPPPPYSPAEVNKSQPPPPGFVTGPPPPGPYVVQQAPGATVPPTTVITTQPAQTVTVVRVGNCPRCQAGIMVENFTCCGICLAIFFFPLGLLCCLLMRDRQCTNCGYSV